MFFYIYSADTIAVDVDKSAVMLMWDVGLMSAVSSEYASVHC